MNTTTKPKQTSLTLGDAKAKLEYIITSLFLSKIRFNLYNKPQEKCFCITAIENAEAVKVIIPSAEIRLDEYSRRLAEIKVSYE